MPPHVLDITLDNLRREFDNACEVAAMQARSEEIQELNQLLRRFRGYQTESDWVHTMLDAAGPHSDYVAVFSIASQTLRLRGQAPAAVLPEGLSFSLSSAAAFASAIASKDPVTTLRHASEVGQALSADHVSERAHIFPITNGDRVSALLFASDLGSDMNALELVCGLGSSVLERKANLALHAQIAAAAKLRKTMPGSVDLPVHGQAEPARPFAPETLAPETLTTKTVQPEGDSHEPAESEALKDVQAEGRPLSAGPKTEQPEAKMPAVRLKEGGRLKEKVASERMNGERLDNEEPEGGQYRSDFDFSPMPGVRTPGAEVKLPAWTDLAGDQRQYHIRAQRFARVCVAEMQLSRPEACRAGREQSDLYLFLKREIDKARDHYRTQFMVVPSMVDYLHLELIQTAAQGDEHKLGADYPGRLQ